MDNDIRKKLIWFGLEQFNANELQRLIDYKDPLLLNGYIYDPDTKLCWPQVICAGRQEFLDYLAIRNLGNLSYVFVLRTIKPNLMINPKVGGQSYIDALNESTQEEVVNIAKEIIKERKENLNAKTY